MASPGAAGPGRDGLTDGSVKRLSNRSVLSSCNGGCNWVSKKLRDLIGFQSCSGSKTELRVADDAATRAESLLANRQSKETRPKLLSSSSTSQAGGVIQRQRRAGTVSYCLRMARNRPPRCLQFGRYWGEGGRSCVSSAMQLVVVSFPPKLRVLRLLANMAH